MKTYMRRFLGLVLPLLVLIWGLAIVVQAQSNSRLRVVHASPEAPSADIYLDGQRVFPNLAYKAVSNYEALTPGTHRLKVLPAGTDSNTPGVIEADLSFSEGKDYTLVAMGNLQDLEFRQFEDNNDPPEGANKARLRIVHASPDAPPVDMCITEKSSCFVTNLTFKNATSSAPLDAGIYNLDARQTGTDTKLLTVSNLRFNDGVVYSIFLVGMLQGSKPFEMVITADASRPPTYPPPTYPPTTGALIAPELLMIVIGTMVTLGAGAWFVWQRFSKS